MARFNRKSAPRVKAGRVQVQNNWKLTPNYYNSEQHFPAINRKRPGAGYRHLLRKKDLVKFIGILPDWNELSRGLNGIVLTHGEEEAFGYHIPGTVHICAWDREIWITVTNAFYEKHRDFLDRLGVSCKSDDDGGYVCEFNENTARAHQLLGTLLHELGHHHDRMTTKSKVKASRGEPYADAYARNYEAQIWTRYQEVFEL
jgi:hypothetical protein